jgi:hypothetical protein
MKRTPISIARRLTASAWAAGVAAHAVRLAADPTAFVLDFLPFEERVIRRDGVRLFNVTYFHGALAPLLDRHARKRRIKYHPRDMSAVFIELPTGGHLRLPCADLGRPAVTLSEQRTATRTLRAEGHANVDDAAVFAAISTQRRGLAEAQRRRPARRADAPRHACPIADRQRSSCGFRQRPTQRHQRPRTRTMRMCLALSRRRPGRRSFRRDASVAAVLVRGMPRTRTRTKRTG